MSLKHSSFSKTFNSEPIHKKSTVAAGPKEKNDGWKVERTDIAFPVNSLKCLPWGTLDRMTRSHVLTLVR